MNPTFKRPNIKVAASKNIQILNRIGLVLIIGLWIFSFWIFNSAPNKVPIHFNINGKVDSYGSKYSLLLLPLLVTVIFTGLHYLSRVPYLFNYPFTITESNYEKAYRNATNSLHYLKFFIIVLFWIIQHLVYKTLVIENTSYHNIALAIILTLIILVPIIIALKKIKEK